MDRRRSSLPLWTMTLLLVGAPGLAEAGGQRIDGYPSWSERVHLELANRARVDPQIEMMMCGANCVEAACYTAQPPLYLSRKNSRAARFHAANMKAMGFFAHTSKCTLADDIGTTWENGCDASAACACAGGQAACNPTCDDPTSRVGRFGGNYFGEIIASGGAPNSAFYLWLYEPGDTDQCKFTTKNGHRFLLLTAGGGVGFGVSSYHVGDFGSPDMAEVGKIASGTHWPQVSSSVEAWANWYDDAGPSKALVDLDGTCEPMTLGRGTAENGAYTAQLDGVGQGCHRYYFVFEDSQGNQVTYPDQGSLGIGDPKSCEDWAPERPPLGPGCDCTPSCGGATCGDDGCGGSCGECQANEACQAGACVCVPACDGVMCGDDGCGGECGSCGVDEACVAGTCEPGGSTGAGCDPLCDGKVCGDDLCGGACGVCPAGQGCVDGLCVDGGETGTTGGSTGGSTNATSSASDPSSSGAATDSGATGGNALPDGYGQGDGDEGCGCRSGEGGGKGGAGIALLALLGLLRRRRRLSLRTGSSDLSAGTGPSSAAATTTTSRRTTPGRVRRTALVLGLGGAVGCGDDGGPSGETEGGTTAAGTTAAGTTAAGTTGASTAGTTAATGATTTTTTTGVASTDGTATTTGATTTTTTTTTEATGSTHDPGTTEGSTGEPSCTLIDFGGPFTSTVETPGFLFELPLVPDTPHRRLTVMMEVTPNDWGGDCYNPYYNPPKLVPIFHQLFQLQRGAHWCKGGNLGEIVLRGPGADRLIGEVYYRETPWTGSGCGPEVVPHMIFGGEKDLAIPMGETRAVTYVHDAEAGTIDLMIGDNHFSGTPQPDSDLLALDGYPLHLVLSRELWLECYDAQGNDDPNAVCCHGPSIGWSWDAVQVEICL